MCQIKYMDFESIVVYFLISVSFIGAVGGGGGGGGATISIGGGGGGGAIASFFLHETNVKTDKKTNDNVIFFIL